MDCPLCGEDAAYVGLHSVECPNPDCLHFSEEHLEKCLQQSEATFNQILDKLDLWEDLDSLLEELWLRTFDSQVMVTPTNRGESRD